ncbi:hypothetical protein BGW42_003150, partial [Actinomortierella wolfii]
MSAPPPAAPSATVTPAGTPTVANPSVTSDQLDAKRRRVSRACDTCRRKKVRCDGLQPSCTNCTTFGFQCTFNDSAKKRGPPKGYIEALENRLHRMESLLGGLVQNGVASKPDLDAWREENEDDLDSLEVNWGSNSTEAGARSAPKRMPSTDLQTDTQVSIGDNNPEPIKEEPEENVHPFDKSAREKLNALSDSLDAMTLEDTSFVRYLGNSSGIDLLHKSQMLKNGSLLVPMKLKEHYEWMIEIENALRQEEEQTALPPRDIADHLIEIYFARIHPLLPILPKASFLRQYRSADPEKRPPVVLLTAMFALASCFSDHPEIVRDNDDNESFGDVYFARAKRLVDFEYEMPRPSAVQALLLMTVYRLTNARCGGRVWVMLGMAIRMCQDMGMHRNSARWHLPPGEAEIRKRLWWSCYIMDRWISASMGRPCAIQDIDCDVDFPSTEEEEWVDADGNAASPRDNNVIGKSEPSFPLRYFVENIKLAQILGEILHRIYSATTRNQNPNQVSTIVSELDTKLTKWLLALPPDLRCNHQSIAAGTTKLDRWVAAINISYYTVLILLHRPFMVPTSLTKSKLSESLPSFNICVSAANSITFLAEASAPEAVSISWYQSTYEIFTSSLIHLTNSASIDLRLQSNARKNLIKSIALLKSLGTTWWNSMKFALMLEDLMAIHLNMEEFNPQGRTFHLVPIQQLADWVPIVLRDINHRSGGVLFMAPKPFGAPQTPSSSSSTPQSSPATSILHTPENHEVKHDQGSTIHDSPQNYTTEHMVFDTEPAVPTTPTPSTATVPRSTKASRHRKT